MAVPPAPELVVLFDGAFENCQVGSAPVHAPVISKSSRRRAVAGGGFHLPPRSVGAWRQFDAKNAFQSVIIVINRGKTRIEFFAREKNSDQPQGPGCPRHSPPYLYACVYLCVHMPMHSPMNSRASLLRSISRHLKFPAPPWTRSQLCLYKWACVHPQCMYFSSSPRTILVFINVSLSCLAFSRSRFFSAACSSCVPPTLAKVRSAHKTYATLKTNHADQT